jgi:glycerophosphoryl diester phosphodiesterase
MGFRNIILTLYQRNYPDFVLIYFGNKVHPFAITMPLKYALTRLPKKLSNAGIHTYVHTVNDQAEARELLQKGVFGIYTESLHEI